MATKRKGLVITKQEPNEAVIIPDCAECVNGELTTFNLYFFKNSKQ